MEWHGCTGFAILQFQRNEMTEVKKETFMEEVSVRAADMRDRLDRLEALESGGGGEGILELVDSAQGINVASLDLLIPDGSVYTHFYVSYVARGRFEDEWAWGIDARYDGNALREYHQATMSSGWMGISTSTGKATTWSIGQYVGIDYAAQHFSSGFAVLPWANPAEFAGDITHKFVSEMVTGTDVGPEAPDWNQGIVWINGGMYCAYDPMNQKYTILNRWDTMDIVAWLYGIPEEA